MIANTVKTETRAIEILQEWIESKGVYSLSTGCTTARCECGETNALRADIWKFNKETQEDEQFSAYVAICDACGDDSLTLRECLIEL